MATRFFVSACVLCAIVTPRVFAQDAKPDAGDAPAMIAPPTGQSPAVSPDALKPLPANDATTEPTTQNSLVGDRFESKSFGVAFRPPADLEQQDKEPDPNVIAEFGGTNGSLKVTRLITGTDMDLIGKTDKDGNLTPGLCDYLIENMKQATPGAKTLRCDLISVGDYDCGVVVVRFSLGTQRWLRQQAFLQAHRKMYYVLNYTVPTTSDGNNADPHDAVAAQAFDQMINSLEVLDLAPIKEDQDLRLYQTRALFVHWSGDVLTKALIHEQWRRILKDGKDIGYMYIVQEPMRSGAVDGIQVSVRSRTMDKDKQEQMDVGSQYFVSLDRRSETWEQVVTVRKGSADQPDKQDLQMGAVFGTSLHKSSKIVEDQNNTDLKQGITDDKFTVDVVHMGKTGDEQPISHPASDWYVPNALQQIFPSIVPLDQPKGYMIQSYIPERRALMNRYMDVGVTQSVMLDGQKVVAVPVSDRLGLEGKPTIYYMSPEGKFLGAQTPSQHITILPTDEKTLLSLWKDANLTKPESIKKPAGN